MKSFGSVFVNIKFVNIKFYIKNGKIGGVL